MFHTEVELRGFNKHNKPCKATLAEFEYKNMKLRISCHFYFANALKNKRLIFANKRVVCI